MAYKLITVEHVKQFLKDRQIGSTFDFLFGEILIPAVGALFAKYCNRPDFDKTTRTEYLSPISGSNRFYLSSPPVAAAQVGPPLIEALRLYQDTAAPRVYGSDAELVSGEDFFVFEDSGLIELGTRFIGGPRSIKVTYTGGYLTDDAVGCPADLTLAAIRQTQLFFDRREQLGLSGQSVEGGSISLLSPDLLPIAITMMLTPYMRPAL